MTHSWKRITRESEKKRKKTIGKKSSIERQRIASDESKTKNQELGIKKRSFRIGHLI